MNCHAVILKHDRTPARRSAAWLCLAAVLLALASAAQTESGGIRKRGQYLRTEVLRTEAERTYSCTLAPTSGSTPTLLFRRQERQRHHEVRIYEVVLEERTTDAETGREGVSYRTSTGDEVRGETSVRETSRDLGPFADAAFTLDGAPIRTDTAGLYNDTGQMLLQRFDDLGANAVDVEVRHADLGLQTVRVSRYLTLRWESKRPDERLRLVQTDLLVALGADFEPLTPADRQGLRLKVEAPETVVPGQDMVVKVTASNEGKRPVSCLVGRLFSRQPWFSGVNFYLGNIQPGASREFERVLRVPASAAPGPLFGMLGMWDIVGAMGDAAQPVATRVSADAPQPAPQP